MTWGLMIDTELGVFTSTVYPHRTLIYCVVSSEYGPVYVFLSLSTEMLLDNFVDVASVICNMARHDAELIIAEVDK